LPDRLDIQTYQTEYLSSYFTLISNSCDKS
jgi:hypothetical protein